MILSQLSIAPVGLGTSLSQYVKGIIPIFEKYNIRYTTNDMATILETKDLDTLFQIVKEAHESMIQSGAQRVITELKIDDRKDKNVKLGDKTSKVQL